MNKEKQKSISGHRPKITNEQGAEGKAKGQVWTKPLSQFTFHHSLEQI